MITNLFSIFDPSSSLLSMSWIILPLIITIIPSKTWNPTNPTLLLNNNISLFINNEVSFNLNNNNSQNNILLLIFLAISLINVVALYPQSFSLTSHLTITLPLSLITWLSIILFGWSNNTNHILSHILPQGTPAALIPFMVIIELSSNLIRPITLCVRLTANLIAGHLLITLLGNSMSAITTTANYLAIISPIILTTLESAVALIQAYVFMTLISLYIAETNIIISNFNPFHLVNISPWPILASINAMSLVMSLILTINNISNQPFVAILPLTLLTAYIWWKNVHREASHQGNHAQQVINILNTGIILFITSEVLFFVAFFWAFLHTSISPTIELGQNWPPLSISPFNPISIPLLNTIILLSSGVTVTWSHHNIINGNYNLANTSLSTTIFLGAIFTLFQAFEYIEAPFSIQDSTFGSSFFIATGFHGLHVIIGSSFLWVSNNRFNNIVNPNDHLIGFECAAWYWHFVDIVWLFLYSIIYWWGA